MTIDGKVYDFSSYRGHPGGDTLLEGCGKDATSLFDTKGFKGEPHSGRATSMHSQYYIGELSA